MNTKDETTTESGDALIDQKRHVSLIWSHHGVKALQNTISAIKSKAEEEALKHGSYEVTAYEVQLALRSLLG